jgi:hypothetical protein
MTLTFFAVWFTVSVVVSFIMGKIIWWGAQ